MSASRKLGFLVSLVCLTGIRKIDTACAHFAPGISKCLRLLLLRFSIPFRHRFLSIGRTPKGASAPLQASASAPPPTTPYPSKEGAIPSGQRDTLARQKRPHFKRP